MQERYVGQIIPGKDVCDMNGDKVGTVARVYRDDAALYADGQPHYEEVMEVKTGPLGLGQRYYIPVTAIDDSTEGALFVNCPAEDFDGSWREKPQHLDKLH
ncbi:MAG: DUF2171 domain-containing protein [Chloroflexota bacterium]|nr:DUF2171 domain-containing protein [Chloroflexota bacterium]